MKGLERQADSLVRERNIEPQRIVPRLQEVTAKRKRILDMTQNRRASLQDALLYAEFLDVASDVDSWIDEKVGFELFVNVCLISNFSVSFYRLSVCR